MKSILVSVRINPRKLAKALDCLQQQNISYSPNSLAGLIKDSIDQAIGAIGYNMPIEPSEASMTTITRMTSQRRGRTPSRAYYPPPVAPTLPYLNPLTTETTLGSSKSTVTDFTPPTDEEMPDEQKE